MCLVSMTSTPSISNNDISCYKILIPVGGKLFTPYRDFLFTLNEVITDKVEVPELFPMWGSYLIEEGYFHSFQTLDEAKNKLLEIQAGLKKEKRKDKPKIYHAIIPAGTSYFLGYWGDICSKSLKITKECFD